MIKITLALVLRVLVLVCLIVIVISYDRQYDLKRVGELLPELAQEPIQIDSSEEPFTFTYRGRDYEIEPVADYELWGLVVSHNDIHAFSDIYHDSDSVDFKDICVIWGANAESEAFKEVTYWSEPWTCWARWERGRAKGFELNNLSNNHLLSDSPSVRDEIEKMRIGDQIYLKGLLVNYSEPSRSDFVRKTSIRRTDEGNGACEILFVDEAKILQEGPAFWRNVSFYSRRICLVLVVAWFLNFLREAYRPMLAPTISYANTDDNQFT